MFTYIRRFDGYSFLLFTVLMLSMPWCTSAVNDQEGALQVHSPIILEEFNLANQKVSMRFEWLYVDADGPFIVLVHLPGRSVSIINSTRFAQSSWYRAAFCNQTRIYHNIQTESRKVLGFLNIWPFDVYNINIFLCFNETLLYDEKHSLLDVVLGTSIQEMSVWDTSYSIDIMPRAPEHLTKIASDYNLTCFYKFQVSITRGSDYPLKNLAYFVPLFFIVVTLACCEIFFIPATRKHLADHLRIFLAFVAIIASSLFSIRTFTPPQLTLIEFIFIIEGIGYTILLAWILSKISRLANHS